MTSQLPVSSWYDAIGDPTVADAILDRIVHSAHRIELFGEKHTQDKRQQEKQIIQNKNDPAGQDFIGVNQRMFSGVNCALASGVTRARRFHHPNTDVRSVIRPYG